MSKPTNEQIKQLLSGEISEEEFKQITAKMIKSGDRVRIKRGFRELRSPNNIGVASDMLVHEGQEFVVSRHQLRTHGQVAYYDDWTWDAVWLELVEEEASVAQERSESPDEIEDDVPRRRVGPFENHCEEILLPNVPPGPFTDAEALTTMDEIYRLARLTEDTEICRLPERRATSVVDVESLFEDYEEIRVEALTRRAQITDLRGQTLESFFGDDEDSPI